MKEKLSTPKKSIKELEKENKNKLVSNVKKQKNENYYFHSLPKKKVFT
ncbi:MAG: hypothetical protein HFI73_07045 [Bacilli bacterium]|jgi:hypothetical protein|nr:hypothetical protein [Bacilli bacterium]